MSSIRDDFAVRRRSAAGRAAAVLWLGLAAALAAPDPGRAQTDTTPPRLLNAGASNHSWVGVHEGDSAVFLVFDEALDTRPGALPETWMFYIRTDVNSAHFIRTAQVVAVNATTLRLDPEYGFFAGQTIQVAYLDRTDEDDISALQDTAGNDSPTFDFTTILKTVPEAFATAVPSLKRPVVAPPGETTIPLEWGMVPSSPDADSFDLQYAATEATPADTEWVDGPQNVTDYGRRCHTCRSYTLVGLEPGTRYWIRLRGSNSTGDGAWTEPVGAHTREPRPPPPPAIEDPPPDAEPPEDAEPLTAEFLNLPAVHDMSSFSFELRFSADVAGLTGERFMPDGYRPGDVISLTHGRITAARRVAADSSRRWEITVDPFDDRALEIALPASAGCAAAGAICTPDGRPLSAAVTASVPGPPRRAPERKLTVAFESGNAPPATHDGSTAVVFNIAFSEAPSGLHHTDMRDYVVKLRQGTPIVARNVERVTAGAHRRWKITVNPVSKANIAVEIGPSYGPTYKCGRADTVCTPDGRKLSNQITAVIAGPPGLSVADARAEEATGAKMHFVTTLSRASTTPVTVIYATRDGTARQPHDYTYVTGTLTFAAGETSKTVSVPILVDAADDGGETFEFYLRSVTGGAYLADATAIGIIDNSGPIPRQWLARLGRSVASQAVDAIETRLEGGGSHVVLGGHRLDLSGRSGGDDAARLLDDLAWAEPTAETSTATLRELLLGSSFSLSAGNEDEGTAVTAWGQFATGGFRGKIDGLLTDGNLSSGFLGLDFGRRRMLGGLAVGFTGASGDFALDGDADRGAMKSALTAVYPYARLNLTKKLNVWGLAGYGAGGLKMKRRLHRETTETDLEMRLGAVGVRGVVLSPKSLHGFSLVARSDAFLMQMRSKAARSGLGRLASSVAQASRVRVSLDTARSFSTEGGGRITPSVRIGVRRDGGDAETGLGVEAGAGLRYVAGRVSIEVSARSLIAHGARSYREWGAQGLIRIDPGRQGHGVSLTVAPRWGAAHTGIGRLRSPAFPGSPAGTPAPAAGRRVEAELGYGFGMPGAPGLVTPYAGLTLDAARRAALTAGARWRVAPETTLAFKATREDGGDRPADIRLVLHGMARW